MKNINSAIVALTLGLAGMLAAGAGGQQTTPLPSLPMKFGVFVVRFDAAGTFMLEGQGWPPLKGTWKADGARIDLTTSGGPKGCEEPGRYQFHVERSRVSFDLVSDTCVVRRMI